MPKRFFASAADSWPRRARISSICPWDSSRLGGMVVSRHSDYIPYFPISTQHLPSTCCETKTSIFPSLHSTFRAKTSTFLCLHSTAKHLPSTCCETKTSTFPSIHSTCRAKTSTFPCLHSTYQALSRISHLERWGSMGHSRCVGKRPCLPSENCPRGR